MNSLGINLSGNALHGVDQRVEELLSNRFASRLLERDHTLWGPEAEAEASQRLGWVDPFDTAFELIPQITQLREQLADKGITRVVLAGMGGSSLGAEVMARAAGVRLDVVDSTDPELVGSILAAGVADTVFVISSKSGSTAETDAARRAFTQALQDAGLTPGDHLIAVTDPGSPLESLARDHQYTAVFEADPTIGGRYSALSAFGLVPAGLAGVELTTIVDDAEAASHSLYEDDETNPALRAAAVLGAGAPSRNKLIITNFDQALPGFGDWIEQLIAESTGKHGTGFLPVIVEPGAAENRSHDEDVIHLHLIADPGDSQATLNPEDPRDDEVQVYGSLGAQLMFWEVTTVAAASLIGVNPFDQPDVESAKVATRAVLAEPTTPEPPQISTAEVDLFGPAGLLGDVEATGETQQILTELFTVLGTVLEDDSYLAVQAYTNRLRQQHLTRLRPALARRYGRPVTFGWGPRFLHSTGQFHKGGPATGVFIQITADSELDLQIPGLNYSFAELITAQAAGDGSVLTETGQPVVRIHLKDRSAAIETLINAAEQI
ncbi:glucose-6-phosphate isomerase [Auritidibacter ignavus]|uniref:glucose-6-phosphate isomerase n=1 Tax=Auritidibacter ignavus TaxID=678932 RepID=UPI00244D4AF7|nr:glucose-6-phosphate isomerase [Auritidibacter ignavus]WGH84341.1 glucose-6-phosphate isomerase [Auritidibacter ignavus]